MIDMHAIDSSVCGLYRYTLHTLLAIDCRVRWRQDLYLSLQRFWILPGSGVVRKGAIGE